MNTVWSRFQNFFSPERLRAAFLSICVCFVLSILIYACESVFFAHRGLWTRFPRPLFSIVETAGVLLLLMMSFQLRGFFWALNGVIFFGFMQWLHLSYFGTFIHPNAIYLFLTNLGEVLETAQSFLGRIWLPVLLFLSQIFAFRWILNKTRPATNLTPWLKWVILVALFYGPVRTYLSGNTYGKQPAVHNLSFSNMYASLSYFGGKVLPHKLSRRETVGKVDPLKVQSVRPQRHIVLVMGESLRYKNLSLYGYERPTTPRLQKMAEEKSLLFRKAFSGGVSTDVSVPMFLNSHQGYDVAPVIVSQRRCLFSLAQDNGFATHYISAQTQTSLQHILNYICPTAIDNLQVGAELGAVEEELTFNDEILVDALKKIDLSTPQFIVLHQRGSHSPYELRYPSTQVIFPLEPADAYEVQQVKHYDNSVHYTDLVLSDLVDELRSRSKLPFDVVFTSDHGQALGENGVWGHVMLNDEVHRVPFLMYSSDRGAFFREVNDWPEYTNHKRISELVIRMLGYEPPSNGVSSRHEFFVMGPDLDGLDGGWLFDFSVTPPARIPDPQETLPTVQQ